MLLKEITYSILELLRNGSIVDDETLDIRLLEEFVRSKRSTYVQSIVDTGKVLPEQFYQYLEVTLVMDVFPNEFVLKTSENLPNIIGNRNGNIISEITSTDLSQYIFTLVNNNRFRASGNGKFLGNVIYVTYRDNNLYFKSTNNNHLHLTNCLVKTAIEDPEDDSNFDVDTDDYPITSQCYDYILSEIMTTNIKLFMMGIPDEINNSDNSTK